MKIVLNIREEKFNDVVGELQESSLCPALLGLEECDDCALVECYDCWKNALKNSEVK